VSKPANFRPLGNLSIDVSKLPAGAIVTVVDISGTEPLIVYDETITNPDAVISLELPHAKYRISSISDETQSTDDYFHASDTPFYCQIDPSQETLYTPGMTGLELYKKCRDSWLGKDRQQ